jgi:hypothetical protein
MLTRDDFRALPSLHRAPVVCGFPPRPRKPRDCHICLKPLPLIRHPNLHVHEGECQAENTRRIMKRANLRRKKRKAALKEEAVSDGA